MDRFLAKYKMINKVQSRFRKNRKTLDNLTLLVESANQAKIENPRNKVCAVVFYISKAFDKVWPHLQATKTELSDKARQLPAKT